MNDIVADMINRIQTGALAGKKSVIVPYSKLTYAIAEALASQGYIASFSRRGKKANRHIEIELAFVDDKPRVKGARRVSKLSQRVYAGADDMRPVRGGYGVNLVSTPKGVLTGEQAKKERVGGEVLLEIW